MIREIHSLISSTESADLGCGRNGARGWKILGCYNFLLETFARERRGELLVGPELRSFIRVTRGAEAQPLPEMLRRHNSAFDGMQATYDTNFDVSHER